ncbi:MAG: ATP-binding protein [Oscillospiraceae bacterium]|nr:ATP-binding protein [Oscillospiraceae bacterium]
MFIGREKELRALNSMYNSDKFEFTVIYGRRRVGKTALINRFTNDKKTIYFMGVESNGKHNLENFSRSIFEFLDEVSADTVFHSFQSALEYVFKKSENDRIILVIDEYPYVARADKSLASTLQMLIDRYKDTSKLMLILCGSSMSYMEDNVLAYKAPLYGRRTAQMKIMPFDFEESCQYLKNFSSEDKALLYGIAGGTPQYLLQVNDKLSVEENIKNMFLNPVSFLYEEPVNLLKQEVREPAIYTAIITAIASGASRMAEISAKVGENTNVCSIYLKNLINLGIVQKENPYGDDTSRKSIYCIEDNMFCFWYRFIPANTSMISRGAADLVYKRIEPYLSDYMGKIFEKICTQYLWKLLLEGRCPVEFSSAGHWWGNDPAAKCQTEIDIMAVQDKKTALFGECKWRNEKTDSEVLETLIRRSRLFPYKNIYYYLFSKSGFTEEVYKKSESMGNIFLISFEEIMREYS